MADAMLDVIGSKELRVSLAEAGYEYVRRHGWDTKKKQYLDLIDFLSTERFADVQAAAQPADVEPAALQPVDVQPDMKSDLGSISAIPADTHTRELKVGHAVSSRR